MNLLLITTAVTQQFIKLWLHVKFDIIFVFSSHVTTSETEIKLK